MIRVILADDHQMMRQGLRLILEREPSVEIIGEAATGLSAMELAARLTPDIMIMDIGMQDLNGIEATRQIRVANPVIKVIGLSAHSDRRFVLGMLDAGATGYVQKSAAGDELIRAVDAVSKGKTYLSPDIAHMVVGSYVKGISPNEDTTRSGLGARERQVLQLLAQGMTSKQIAPILHISIRTVETHRRNVMMKLRLHNIAELTRYAIREGMVVLEP